MNSQSTAWESYVYISPDGATIYEDKRSLGLLAHNYEPPSPWQSVISVTTFGGAIAVIICLTLCVMMIWKRTDSADPVPVLSSSLTTILAFYFGSQAART